MIDKNIKLTELYFSSDLALVTAISLYYPVEAIDRTNPSKAEFIFKREQGLDQIIEAFWRKQLQVDALTYFSQLKHIKSRIYESQQKTSMDYMATKKEAHK